MKTWQDIYTKYKDTELMKEFEFDFLDNDLELIRVLDIKDMWGWIIVFAETKKIQVYIHYIYHKHYEKADILGMVQSQFRQFDNTEQAMLWCADKFFEVSK